MRLPGVPVRIAAAAAALTLALVGLVVREGVARAQGQEVLLPIQGYDPRSLLSGHYVRFQIGEESPPETPCPPGADGIATNPKGWVALSSRNGHHVATGAAFTRAEAARLGQVVVRGELTCLAATSTFQEPGRPPRQTPMTQSVTLDIGIDRIYVGQAEAEKIEAAIRAPARPQDAFAVVSVGRDGKARLRGLVIGGRRTDLDWF